MEIIKNFFIQVSIMVNSFIFKKKEKERYSWQQCENDQPGDLEGD